MKPSNFVGSLLQESFCWNLHWNPSARILLLETNLQPFGALKLLEPFGIFNLLTWILNLCWNFQPYWSLFLEPSLLLELFSNIQPSLEYWLFLPLIWNPNLQKQKPQLLDKKRKGPRKGGPPKIGGKKRKEPKPRRSGRTITDWKGSNWKKRQIQPRLRWTHLKATSPTANAANGPSGRKETASNWKLIMLHQGGQAQ